MPDGDGAVMLEEVEVTAGENTVFIEEAIVVETDSDRSGSGGSSSGGSGTRRDSPTPDSDKGINALREVCKARRDLTARWRYLNVKEANNCDNPYRMPVPGPADQSLGRLAACTDPDEPFFDLEREIREGGRNTCGPFAQPGADGSCQGRGMFFTSRGSARGSYAFAASGVLGVQPCDPRFCNPPPGR